MDGERKNGKVGFEVSYVECMPGFEFEKSVQKRAGQT